MTQVDFAAMLHRDKQTIFHWCAGEREIPPEAEAIIRLLLDGVITPADIERALRQR
jgi:DNA-binding transcriptional regulator YiaG